MLALHIECSGVTPRHLKLTRLDPEFFSLPSELSTFFTSASLIKNFGCPILVWANVREGKKDFMDFQKHLTTAWKTTLKFLLPLLLLTFLLCLFGALTLGILLPVFFAGYVSAVFMILREGRPPHFKDLFSHIKLILPLVLFSLVCEIIAGAGFFLFMLPGYVLSIILSYLFLYVIPLMADQGMGIISSVKMSIFMTTRGNFFDNLVVYLLFLGFTMIGASTLIGWLFLMPFTTLFLASVYEEKRVK